MQNAVAFRVPLEIQNHIVSFTDKQTLLASSLVCSGWLYASRRELFKSVVIRSPDNTSDIFLDFLQFLDTCCTRNVGRCVLSLTLEGIRGPESTPQQLPLHTLFAILAKTTLLRSLRLETFSFTHDITRDVLAAPGSVRLDLLVIRDCEEAREHDGAFQHLVGSFAAIDCLKLWQLPNLTSVVGFNAPRAPVIKEVFIAWVAAPVLYDVVKPLLCQSALHEGSLNVLSIFGWGRTDDDFYALAYIIHILGDRLHTLNFLAFPFPSFGTFLLFSGWNAFNLHSCTNLVRLMLSLYDENEFYQEYGFLSTAALRARTISDVVSSYAVTLGFHSRALPHLKILLLVFSTPWRNAFVSLDARPRPHAQGLAAWSHLDAGLARFRALKHVCIMFVGVRNGKDLPLTQGIAASLEGFFHAYMPITHARGLLWDFVYRDARRKKISPVRAELMGPDSEAVRIERELKEDLWRVEKPAVDLHEFWKMCGA